MLCRKLFEVRKAVNAVWIVGLVVSCAAPDSLGPNSTSQKLKIRGSVTTGGCDQSRPSGANTADAFPTCVAFQFIESEQNYASSLGSADMTELVWSGQSFDEYGDAFDPVCLRQVQGVDFTAYIPEYGEDATFKISIPLDKFSDDGYSVEGLPMATYSLPENVEFWSTSPPGKYSMRGGLLRAVCRNYSLRVGGVRIGGGKDRWYDYTGVIYLNPVNPSGGGGGSGWGWSSWDRTNGAGSGWQTALSAFLGNGNCIGGWEIWVDGVQRCDAFGNRMM